MTKRRGYTTIWVSIETYRDLKALRKLEGETLDSILRRLIHYYKNGEESDEIIVKCYSKTRKSKFSRASENPRIHFY